MKQKLLLLLAISLVIAPLRADDPEDASGTITTGGVAQTLLAAHPSPRYFFFQNISADTLWVRFNNQAATQDSPSIKVVSGATLVFEGSYVPGSAASVIGPNTGAKFVCKWK